MLLNQILNETDKQNGKRHCNKKKKSIKIKYDFTWIMFQKTTL